MSGETRLFVERPRLGPRGWWYEACVFALYGAIYLALVAFGLLPDNERGWAIALTTAVAFATMLWVVRSAMFIGRARRQLTVTDRAIRIGSVLVPLADVVDVRALRGPELREVDREGQVTGRHRWRAHESDDQALLVTQRQLDGRDAGWVLGTHDVDRLAQVVGAHAGTAVRPRPHGATRPLPFHGHQGVDRLRASVFVMWGLLADVVLWVYSDLWSVLTLSVLALVVYTGRRRVRIDEHGIQVGTAHIDSAEIVAVRCVERAEASGASLMKSRLPLFGPAAALLVHTDDGRLWALGIPHPLDVDGLAPKLP